MTAPPPQVLFIAMEETIGFGGYFKHFTRFGACLLIVHLKNQKVDFEQILEDSVLYGGNPGGGAEACFLFFH